VLDKNPNWFLRREIYDIHFPELYIVRDYLKNEVNPKLINHKMSEDDISYILKNIGGNLTDINNLITCLMRGDDILYLIQRMILDSVLKITEIFESYVDMAHKEENEDKKQIYYGKFLRFWKLIEYFVKFKADEIVRSFKF
jgi:hypothetical protein